MPALRREKRAFKPRARLILLLGDQLIRDSGIAVFELVKNAYDADATNCGVRLINVSPSDSTGSDEAEASIVIEDDGHGMDIDTVLDVWLEPGTPYRKNQRVRAKRTQRFRRRPLGEKGVGRFAVHKLGQHVQLVTRRRNRSEVVVRINWRTFEREAYLSQVPVTVVERTPRVFKGSRTGTRITITDLNEMPWRRGRVRSLFRAITSICSPLKGPDRFEPRLDLEPHSDWLEGLLRPDEAMEFALFHFHGKILNNALTYDFEFTPGTRLDRVQLRCATNRMKVILEQQDGLSSAKDGIGPIGIDFHIFDREPQILRLCSTDPAGLKKFLDSNGGVRVYRDGMRVYDFGEPGNDWLELGGRRVNVPTKRIGNNLIIGSVTLDLYASEGLIEKTNREGFVENRAYEKFRETVAFAVKQAEAERNIDKKRIRRAYTRPRQKQPVLDDLSQLREKIEARKLAKELGPYIDRIESQYRDVMDRLLVAAGAGLNMAAVFHEVEKGILSLQQALEKGENRRRLLSLARRLSDMVDGLTWLIKKSPRASISANILVRQALFNWSFRFEAHKIRVTNGMELSDPDPEFAVFCRRRLIMAALMNLIDNSIYWLDTKVQNRQLYLGTTYEVHDRPSLVVADNGPGFLDPPEFLVEPFFTRKPDGMGLGLHIADEIMKSHEGRILFPDPGDITLPRGFNGAIVLLEFTKESK